MEGLEAMIVLSIRTDSDRVELVVYQGQKTLARKKWPAGRELSGQIVDAISELLEQCGRRLEDIEGLVFYKGPGSFTGLRIGASVANSIAYALSVPIVASGSKNWVATGLGMLKDGRSQEIIMPEYGHGPNITLSKTK
jgi:tRNA threonylcarbamoyladenosine biosynthesis protein TsaB